MMHSTNGSDHEVTGGWVRTAPAGMAQKVERQQHLTRVCAGASLPGVRRLSCRHVFFGLNLGLGLLLSQFGF